MPVRVPHDFNNAVEPFEIAMQRRRRARYLTSHTPHCCFALLFRKLEQRAGTARRARFQLRKQTPKHGQSIFAAVKRAAWFKRADFARQSLETRAQNIRQVGDENIERFSDALEQIAFDKFDARAKVQALRVHSRDAKRVARNIGGNHARVRQVMCECQRKCARSCANIYDDRRRVRYLSRRFERELHKKFGFVTRNQDAAINDKIESVKLLMPQDVRQRFVLGTARDVRGISRGNIECKRLVQTRQHQRARRFKRVREQEFGLQARVVIFHRRAERARRVEERVLQYFRFGDSCLLHRTIHRVTVNVGVTAIARVGVIVVVAVSVGVEVNIGVAVGVRVSVAVGRRVGVKVGVTIGVTGGQ